MFRCS